ncbi:MAG: PIG-L family deacetylase [Acidobacteriota bacterium]|nr:PIG-L family deacetylase [Acidobacteriota bacterium]
MGLLRSPDCTLATTMFLAERIHNAAVSAALAGLIVAASSPFAVMAQQPAQLPAAAPTSIALPLPEDRGQAALEQTLKRLGTTASVMMIVAHPDDEDGALLTYLSRGLGVRATLFTLTRGEGGQNAMSVDTYDALGLIRTNELLKAGEFYGAKQLWGTEADFGFSKTQEEAFARWGHDRVLYDAVLAVRRERPQVIVATFAGAVSDGHGQHQVSGEIAQEVFKAAADPTVFPDQLKDGLQPWQPLAVYSRVPFAPITQKGMFDYATGKWAPARFHNYVTGQWITGAPSADVTIPVGTWDSDLGRSYTQIAREGWGMQKSQNGGANPSLSGPESSSYHLWAVAPIATTGAAGAQEPETSLFHNAHVNIDTSVAGLAYLAPGDPPEWLSTGLRQINTAMKQFDDGRKGQTGTAAAEKLAPIYRQALDLRAKVAASSLDARAKAGLLFELDAKIGQFQSALADLLGLDVVAFRTSEARVQQGGFRGSSADETPRSVSPGQEFRVRVHTAQATTATRMEGVWLASQTGEPWKSDLSTGTIDPAAPTADPIFQVRVPDNAEPTAPYFTRPSIEQPYYDISNPAWRGRSFAPYPLAAWAEFTFNGLPIRVGQVVQTLERVTGPGGIYEPLVVTPAIGLRIEPEARILPLDGSALPVRVTVHTEAAAGGTVELKLPAGWQAVPAEAQFQRSGAGDTDPIVFSVTPAAVKAGAYSIQAVAHSGGRAYQTGWQSVGYAGLRPYNQYKTAELQTRKVDVKLAPGLRIGYVMGTGDLVPEAIQGMGATPHLLTPAELKSGDLSAWNVIVIGIRAYSVRPELTAAEPRLDEFVRNGGTLIVQYQSANFPAPLPLSMGGRMPERVVDEQTPVKLLAPSNPLLAWPNVITTADFDGWVEERGHSFLESWDPGYTALTETADAGQDPQRGGLIVAHPGKGTYIYVAYALYRQLPELVPGSYRLLANLLSARSMTR